MMDTASIIKDYLVYAPQHDTTPQRMRLRVKAGQDVQDLLYQIERQLEGDEVPALSDSQSSTQYSIFALDDCKTALVPLADAPLEVLRVSSALYILADNAPSAPLQLAPPDAGDTGACEDDNALRSAEKDRQAATNVIVGEVQSALPQEKSALPPALLVKEGSASRGDDLEADERQDGTACDSCCDAKKQLRTTRTMLRVVDRVCADLALHAVPGHRPMDEQDWQALLAYAMERQKVTERDLDESTVRAFRRAIVDPIARVQHLRDESHAAPSNLTSSHVASPDSRPV